MKIKDFAFSPADLTVPVSSTVRVTNMDQSEHDWSDKDGAFGTELLSRNEMSDVPLDKPGTYMVICTVHPQMTGSVTVE